MNFGREVLESVRPECHRRSQIEELDDSRQCGEVIVHQGPAVIQADGSVAVAGKDKSQNFPNEAAVSDEVKIVANSSNENHWVAESWIEDSRKEDWHAGANRFGALAAIASDPGIDVGALGHQNQAGLGFSASVDARRFVLQPISPSSCKSAPYQPEKTDLVRAREYRRDCARIQRSTCGDHSSPRP